MAKVRVLVAGGTDIELTGITTILNNIRSFEVIATASSASKACDIFEEHNPDLLFFSPKMNDMNIHEVMDRITQNDPDAAVIVLSDSVDTEDLNRALKAGISGYLLKSISKKELQDAAQKALKGEKVFSNPISKLMTKKYIDISQEKYQQEKSDVITKRELEILQFIVDGYTSREIAKQLYISPRTVDIHRTNLLQKLNIKNTAGLVRFAIEEGLYQN